MNLESRLNHLKEKGFNIFFSAKVSDLPSDLFNFSPEHFNKTLCLIGSGGKSLWEKLPHPLILDNHPIDEYSITAMKDFSDSSEILFPNDRYLLPLQRLGRFFNLCHQSPIGLDISEEFGLWFSFRGVFLIDEDIPKQFSKKASSPCENCHQKPCLSAHTIYDSRSLCPVKKEHQYTTDQMSYHLSAQKILR